MTYIIQIGKHYYNANDLRVQNPALAEVFTSLYDAKLEVSELAKVGERDLRVRRFHNGVVTNLKE